MILFYSETITERIKYVVHFILKEQMGIDVEITSDYSYCEQSSLCIINYSSKVFTKNTSSFIVVIIVFPISQFFEILSK